MAQDMTEPHANTFNGPADAPQEPEATLNHDDLSAREAVRRAVAELGAEAELDDVIAHIQAKYGLSPQRGTVQTYLSLARKDVRDGVSGEPKRRGRSRKTADNGHPSAAPAAAIDEVIEAVELLRDLCDRLGDDNVRRLLDTL